MSDMITAEESNRVLQNDGRYCGPAMAVRFARTVIALHADRDRLAAANAALEAQVARLVGALQSIAANTCCDGCQEAARVARAALAEVQADARREGGE